MRVDVAGCARCPLHENGLVVNGEGNHEAPLAMFIGEGPGFFENKTGRPFVGKAGTLLRGSLSALGVPLTELYFTNAVKHWTGQGNRNPKAFEIDACLPWLELELKAIHPQNIVLLGGIAEKAWNKIPEESRPSVPLFKVLHPAATFHGKAQMERFKREITAVAHVLLGKSQEEIVTAPWAIVEPWMLPLDGESYGLDTETDKGDHLGDILVRWQLSDGRLSSIGTSGDLDTLRTYMDTHRGYGTTWVHNLKYDLAVLRRAGIDDTGVDLECSMLLAYVAREDEVGLKPLASRLCGLDMRPIGELLGKGPHKRTVSEVHARPERPVPNAKGKILAPARRKYEEAVERFQKAIIYDGKDPVANLRVVNVLGPQLEPEQWRYYKEVERPLVDVLLTMEQTGVRVDRGMLESLGPELQAEMAEQEKEFHKHIGDDISISAPAQVVKGLLRLDVPLHVLSKGGSLSTTREALLAAFSAMNEDGLPPGEGGWATSALIAYRRAQKLWKTYVVGLTNGLDGEDRVHTYFNQCGHEKSAGDDVDMEEAPGTSRLSSKDPNLQNIPIRGRIGDRIRSLFVPSDGMLWVKGDYSQQECRIFGDYTGAKTFEDAYPLTGLGVDLHAANAELWFGRNDKKTRDAAKTLMYAIMYGAGVFKVKKIIGELGLDEEAAKDILSNMRKHTPEIVNWPDEIEWRLRTVGYVDTKFGWRNYYPNYYSPVNSLRNEAIRQAANCPIQGTGAGACKKLMIATSEVWSDANPNQKLYINETDRRLYMHGLAAKFGGRLLLTVHDEVDFEIPERDALLFARELEWYGQEVAKPYMKIPLKLDVSVGTSWGKVQPI